MVDKDGFYEELLSYYAHHPKKIVAQSKIAKRWKRAAFPIIDLNLETTIGIKAIQMSKKFAPKDQETGYTLGFISGYQENQNQYTIKDIEKVLKLKTAYLEDDTIYFNETDKEIIDQINFIEVIEVDEKFNIISYE